MCEWGRVCDICMFVRVYVCMDVCEIEGERLLVCMRACCACMIRAKICFWILYWCERYELRCNETRYLA